MNTPEPGIASKLSCDLHYIQKMSGWLDLQMLVNTPMKSRNNPWRKWADCAFLLGVALVFHLSSIPCILSYRIQAVNEGVYLYSASLWAGGVRPYADFFLAHPPGVIALAAGGLRLGIGMVGLRLIFWLGGFVLALLVMRLVTTGRSPREKGVLPIVAATAISLTFSSEIVLDGTSLVMTDLPAMLLVMVGVVCLLGRSRWRAVAAGLFVAMATVFKLQALVVLPGFFVLNWASRGLRGGTRDNLVLGISIVVLTGLIHILLADSFTHYIQDVCVFQFRRSRPRMNLASRIQVLKYVLAEPPFVLGLVGSAMLLAAREGTRRGFGWFCLVTTVALTLAGKTLCVHYYLMIIPFLSVSAAWLLVGFHRATPGIKRRAVMLGVVAVAGIQVLNLATRIGRPIRDRAWETRLIQRLRELPARTILTADPKIALLGGKSLPRDYYIPDNYPLIDAGGGSYERWVSEILPSCDCVVITSRLRRDMGRSNFDAIVRSGKPVICAEAEDEIAFQP